jgi:hypothetical protein
MKTILGLFAIIVFVNCACAQQRIRPVKDRDYYLEKGHHLTTTGWILVSTGAVATTAGILIIKNSAYANDLDTGLGNVLAGALVMVVGEAAIIGSIPCFIIGRNMKKKAARFSFNNQRLLMPAQNSFVARFQPGISLQLAL